MFNLIRVVDTSLVKQDIYGNQRIGRWRINKDVHMFMTIDFLGSDLGYIKWSLWEYPISY